MAEHGPYDGLLGFSQGGAMLGLLCGLQQQGKLPFSFRFAIFASAFRSRSSPHQSLYSEKITLPTLHVYGQQDKVGSLFLYKHLSVQVVLDLPEGFFLHIQFNANKY